MTSDRNISSRALRFAVATTVFAIVAPDYAAAQTTTEEIIVTARKREESLQRVPVAVTAYSGDDLIRQGVRAPGDLANQIPSLSVRLTGSSPSSVVYSLRGQTVAEPLLTMDAAVGVYVDGVNIARSKPTNAGFFDLERVEVLKGPQGTLYGRNTTGGAINFITKGAEYDGIHGYVSAEYGNHDNQKFNGAINLPIVAEKLAVRLGYQRWARDGYGRSATTGQDLGGDRNQHFFRGTLQFDPADDLSITVKGDWFRARENGYLNAPLFYSPASAAGGGAMIQAGAELGLFTPADLPALFGFVPLSPAQLGAIGTTLGVLGGLVASANADLFTNFVQNIGRDDADAFTIGGTILWDVSDNVQIKSITGFRKHKISAVFDMDGTQFQFLEVGVGNGGIPLAEPGPGGLSSAFSFDLPIDQDYKAFTQEFNVSGTAVNGRLTWLGGVFYSNENGEDNQTARALPFLTGVGFLNTAPEIQATSWSVYSHNDFAITDDLTLTFGGRYTEERKGMVNTQSAAFDPTTGIHVCGTGLTGPGGFPLMTPNQDDCRTEQEATFTGFSWHGGLDYQVTDDVLAYVRTSRSFRGGAWNLRVPDADPAKPEFARDIEVGVKADWFGNRLRTNLAAYTTKYSEKQESIIITRPNGTLATVLQNAASAKIKGAEAEVTALPFEGFTLRGTASYLWGKFESFPTALPITGGTVPVDASGERFGDPRWHHSVSGRYEFPVFNGTLGTQIDWTHTTGAVPTARNINPLLPDSVLDLLVGGISGTAYGNGRRPVGLVNGRLDYEFEDYGVTVSAFVTNLTNKKYALFGIDSFNTGGVQTGYVQEPRMWGFVIRKGFGGE